jgi:dienelactone hydrolase
MTLPRSAFVVLAVVGATAAGAGASGRVTLSVSPRSGLVDAPVEIKAMGLKPRQAIILQAVTRDTHGTTWRSRIQYHATIAGIVDTHSNMRLFWSMRPLRGSGELGLLPAPTSGVSIAVLSEDRLLAESTFTRRLMAADVTTSELTVAKDGLAATFHSQPGTDRHPAVLLLGGSAGGHGGAGGALLASHGYPSLSLGYFGEPGLPQHLQDVPLEYFQRALHWLAAQSGVDPKRITLIGISRGAEAAILVAANYSELVHGVVACTTDAHVLEGMPLAGDHAAWTIGGRPILGGLLPIDRVAARTLITGGGKDEIVDSGPATRELVDLARANGRTNVTGRVYPNAGHGVGCRIPNVPAASEVEVSPRTVLSLGGTSAANSQAADASWPALLRIVAGS